MLCTQGVEERTYILPSLLDRVHQAVKVGAERLQAGGIQEEAALAGGVGSCAAGIAALLRGGDLLLEESALGRVEPQVGDWDGGHVHIVIVAATTWSECSSRPVCDEASDGSPLAATVVQRCKLVSAQRGDWDCDGDAAGRV